MPLGNGHPERERRDATRPALSRPREDRRPSQIAKPVGELTLWWISAGSSQETSRTHTGLTELSRIRYLHEGRERRVWHSVGTRHGVTLERAACGLRLNLDGWRAANNKRPTPA